MSDPNQKTQPSSVELQKDSNKSDNPQGNDNSDSGDRTEPRSEETKNVNQAKPEASNDVANTSPACNKLHDSQSATNSNAVSLQIHLEQQLQKTKKDLEGMVLRYANSERVNLENKKKADDLDKKIKKAIKDNEQLANRIRLLTNDKNQLTDTLNAKLAQLTVLEQKNSHLTNVQGVRLKECEEKMKILEKTNEELSEQIESYKSKEGELLDFSERLSMKHMLLQNELDEALKKVPNYKDLYEAALIEKEEMTKNMNQLQEQLNLLRLNLKNEQDLSDNLRAEMEKNEFKFKYNLEELQNEIKVIRRKNQIANKELVKEIKLLQSKLDAIESNGQIPCLKAQ